MQLDENDVSVLEVLYEEYKKGEAAQWESVNCKRAGLNRKDFIKACNYLKAEGYIPNFKYNENVNIYWIGAPGEVAIEFFEELDKENE